MHQFCSDYSMKWPVVACISDLVLGYHLLTWQPCEALSYQLNPRVAVRMLLQGLSLGWQG